MQERRPRSATSQRLAPLLVLAVAQLAGGTLVVFNSGLPYRTEAPRLALWLSGAFLCYAVMLASIASRALQSNSRIGVAVPVLALFGYVLAFTSAYRTVSADGASFTKGGELAILGGLDSVYFTLTLATTGFGDITPASSLARLVVVVQLASGALFITVAIGLLAAKLHSPRSRS